MSNSTVVKKEKREVFWKYILITYIVFWLMVLGIGGTASFIFNASDYIMRWVIVICSWAPTIVLVIMYKKLVPESNIKSFYKDVFSRKIDYKLLGIVTIIMIGVFLLAALLISVTTKTAFNEQVQFVPVLLLGNIFFTIFQGASGEESGWRGYLLPKMETKYGFLKGNIILGIIWGFWHLPLWFTSGEYSGLSLLLYIVVFMISVISVSVFIGCVMRKSNNLFVAFWMHFIFNFTTTFFIGKSIELLAAFGFLYFIVAVGSVILVHSSKHNKHSLVF